MASYWLQFMCAVTNAFNHGDVVQVSLHDANTAEFVKNNIG